MESLNESRIDEKASSPGALTDAPGSTTQALKAVIADDDPISRQLLNRALCSAGFIVLAFPSGEDCIEEIQRFKPDVIVLDVMMPRVCGYSLCRQLKETLDLRDVPILFLTALSNPQDKLEGFEAGAADFISKPFDRGELLARVKVHAELFTAQRKIREHAASLEELVDERMRMLINADRLVTLGTMSAKTLHDLQNCLTYSFASLDLAETLLERLEAANRESLSGEEMKHWTMLREAICDARSGVARVDETASGLRKYSRHVSSEALESLPLAAVVDRAVSIVGPRARALVTVANHVAPEILVVGNRRLLEQVFVNLLLNAADALEERKGTVKISAWSAGREVVVTCHDDGPGIPEVIRGKVFQPFFTTKDEERGTGLGLAIVQEILAGHRGSIRLKEVEQGTCFEIHLPGAR